MERPLDTGNPSELLPVEPTGPSGELAELIQQVRARLRDNGPKVDYAALFAYLDRDLPADQLQEVERYISTWRRWHDAYWELRAHFGLRDGLNP